MQNTYVGTFLLGLTFGSLSELSDHLKGGCRASENHQPTAQREVNPRSIQLL